MSFPELPNPHFPSEHPGAYPRAPLQGGALGGHRIEKIHKKSSLAQIAKAVEVVAKVAFTLVFALPIGVSLLTAKKQYSHGALGGKGDRMATKVRKFFGEFFGAKISNKLFGDANKAALEHGLKNKYHEFFKNHPSLDFSLFRNQVSNVLNAVVTLSTTGPQPEEARQRLVESLFELPTNIRKELFNNYDRFTSLTNQQFTLDEFNKLNQSNELMNFSIPPNIYTGEGISKKILVDLPKNKAMANYYKDDVSELKKYKENIVDILKKIDQTSTKLLEALLKTEEGQPDLLINLVGGTFSQEEIKELKQQLSQNYEAYKKNAGIQKKLLDQCPKNDEVGKNIIKLLVSFLLNFELLEDKFSVQLGFLKQNLLEEVTNLTKEKKPTKQAAELFLKQSKSIFGTAELVSFRNVLGLSNTRSASEDQSASKYQKVRFQIKPKPGYESRFDADLRQIQELLKKVGTQEISSKDLILDLQLNIARFQGCCQVELNKEDIEQLLKPPEGATSLNKDQIDEIVRFMMLPSKKSRS